MPQQNPACINALREFGKKSNELIVEIQSILKLSRIELNQVLGIISQFLKDAIVPVINAIDEDIAFGRIPEVKKEIVQKYVREELQRFKLIDYGNAGEDFNPAIMTLNEYSIGSAGKIIKCLRRGIKDIKGNILSFPLVDVGEEKKFKELPQEVTTEKLTLETPELQKAKQKAEQRIQNIIEGLKRDKEATEEFRRGMGGEERKTDCPETILKAYQSLVKREKVTNHPFFAHLSLHREHHGIAVGLSGAVYLQVHDHFANPYIIFPNTYPNMGGKEGWVFPNPMFVYVADVRRIFDQLNDLNYQSLIPTIKPKRVKRVEELDIEGNYWVCEYKELAR